LVRRCFQRRVRNMESCQRRQERLVPEARRGRLERLFGYLLQARSPTGRRLKLAHGCPLATPLRRWNGAEVSPSYFTVRGFKEVSGPCFNGETQIPQERCRRVRLCVGALVGMGIFRQRRWDNAWVNITHLHRKYIFSFQENIYETHSLSPQVSSAIHTDPTVGWASYQSADYTGRQASPIPIVLRTLRRRHRSVQREARTPRDRSVSLNLNFRARRDSTAATANLGAMFSRLANRRTNPNDPFFGPCHNDRYQARCR